MKQLPNETVSTEHSEMSLARYRLIEAVLREQIVSGEYVAGDKLPTESELCAMFGSSRPTVRQALAALQADNLVQREHGRGTFIRPLPERTGSDRFEISFEQLIEPPQPIGITIQRSGLIGGYGIAHSTMGLPRGSELFYFVRIYSLADQPIGAAKVHVPSEFRESLRPCDMSERNIPRTVALRSGKVLGSCTFSVDSTLAEPRYAEMVGARAGAPLTSIRRTSRDTDDKAIEHTHLLLRPDLVHLVTRRTFDDGGPVLSRTRRKGQ